MQFDPPLIAATLIRRYKRFLFDAVLEETGEAITGSCPNTGSMLGLNTPGSRIWLSRNDDGKRKYPHRFELIEADGTVVGVNTGLPNRLAEEAIALGSHCVLAICRRLAHVVPHFLAICRRADITITAVTVTAAAPKVSTAPPLCPQPAWKSKLVSCTTLKARAAQLRAVRLLCWCAPR